MFQEESIYNLLPRPEQPPEKPKMYKSRHSALVAPSYSTLCTQGTAKLASNTQGVDMLGDPKRRQEKGSIGKPGNQPDPARFLKKGTGRLPALQSSGPGYAPRHTLQEKKASVPKRTERPVMGLTTDKNFVVSNAVDAIMTAPAKPRPQEAHPTQRPGFGKVPPYLKKVKSELAKEHAYLQQLQQPPTTGQRMREMGEDEKQELVKRMKEKWTDMHKQYLSLTFSLDTCSKVQRKEAIEAQLEQLEKAIAKLSKKVIYVYDDTAPPY